MRELTALDVSDADDAIARLEIALALLANEVAPPLGWEARVLAAIAHDQVERRASVGPSRREAMLSRLFLPPVRAWPWGS